MDTTDCLLHITTPDHSLGCPGALKVKTRKTQKSVDQEPIRALGSAREGQNDQGHISAVSPKLQMVVN